MRLPLADRKARLAAVLDGSEDTIRYSDHQIGPGAGVPSACLREWGSKASSRGGWAAERYGDRRVFYSPIQPRTGQQTDIAAVEPDVHAVSVEFGFGSPSVAARRFPHELADLQPDPSGGPSPDIANAPYSPAMVSTDRHVIGSVGPFVLPDSVCLTRPPAV
jgi:hypothetical protein